MFSNCKQSKNRFYYPTGPTPQQKTHDSRKPEAHQAVYESFKPKRPSTIPTECRLLIDQESESLQYLGSTSLFGTSTLPSPGCPRPNRSPHQCRSHPAHPSRTAKHCAKASATSGGCVLMWVHLRFSAQQEE